MGKSEPVKRPGAKAGRFNFVLILFCLGAIPIILYYLSGVLFQEQRWQTIVVHHTASSIGNLEYIKKIHQKKHGWPDIGYHFVINNGSLNTTVGQIEESNLWKTQSAHFSTKIRRVNQHGIAVVLVGHFDNRPVPTLQYEALVNLLVDLIRQYDIPVKDIIGHNDLQNTACPGRHLNIPELRRRVQSALERRLREEGRL